MAADPSTFLPLRPAKSVWDFLVFWYLRGSKDFWRKEISFIKGAERDIGILINLKMITEPIFSDYTIIGRFIGPVFRLLRVVFGCVCVVFFSIAIVIVYAVWLVLPPVALIMVLKNLFYVLAG